MKSIRLFGWMMLLSFVLTGCIREELKECPPLKIVLEVEDKNYFNIDEAEKLGLMKRVDENLPFASYVHTLHYVISDEKGTIIKEQVNTPVEGDDKTLEIALPASLPYGRYVITAWGNLKSDEALQNELADFLDLEADGAALQDVYMVSDTIDYRYGNEEYHLGMRRTKGNLVVQALDVPDLINFSTKKLKGVLSRVDNSWHYSESMTKATQTNWSVSCDIVTKTLVGPSLRENGTTLRIRFFVQEDEENELPGGVIQPDDAEITLYRNEITILRYIYDPDKGSFKIYVYVNDLWQEVHSMEID